MCPRLLTHHLPCIDPTQLNSDTISTKYSQYVCLITATICSWRWCFTSTVYKIPRSLSLVQHGSKYRPLTMVPFHNKGIIIHVLLYRYDITSLHHSLYPNTISQWKMHTSISEFQTSIDSISVLVMNTTTYDHNITTWKHHSTFNLNKRIHNFLIFSYINSWAYHHELTLDFHVLCNLANPPLVFVRQYAKLPEPSTSPNNAEMRFSPSN